MELNLTRCDYVQVCKKDLTRRSLRFDRLLDHISAFKQKVTILFLRLV